MNHKRQLSKVEGELALWLPFAITIGFVTGFSLSSWGFGQVILVVFSFLSSLLNARILLFGKD